MGQKGVGKAALKTERDKLALVIKTHRKEQAITKEKSKQNKLENNTAQVIKRSSIRGKAMGPASQVRLTSDNNVLPGVGTPFKRPSAFTKGNISGALVSGAFPLLFGQGPLGAAAGFGGGLLGGAIGGQTGGFAGGLVATAIATQIQQTIDFRKAIEDLNRSIEATGGQSLFTARQINEFAKSMRMTKEEALEALKAFEQFGAAARISLSKVFGDEATFNMLASLKDNAAILSQMDQITKNLGFEQAGLVLEILNTQGARAAENKILELTIKKNKALNLQIKERIGAEGRLRQIRKQQRTEEELRVQQEIDNAKTLLDLQIKRTEEERRQAIIKAPVDELQRLLDPLNQVNALAQSIGDSFQNSFKGIITGSMTAQGALRNLFMRTADHFADMAAQILANQIKAGILGLFSNFLTPALTPTPFKPAQGTFGTNIPSGTDLPAGSFNVTPRPRTSRGVGLRADGGPVMRGGSYIVGERGPEMFSPGVSGMITPNHELGGSTNIVVNVDASGSSVEGNDIQANQFGNVLAAAIQAELINQKRSGGLLSNT